MDCSARASERFCTGHGTGCGLAALNPAFEVNVTEISTCMPILSPAYDTSAVPLNSHYLSHKALSSPSRRFSDVGAGDRVWQLRVPQAAGSDMAHKIGVFL